MVGWLPEMAGSCGGWGFPNSVPLKILWDPKICSPFNPGWLELRFQPHKSCDILIMEMLASS